ncbi:unnamed protein product [Effrenium voratum]|uniref:Calcineurin-like phosphoesterase domain-containing protein n=1 Tax=Effrenium voratum TaxID=2562239 RepID=A0AA36IWV0_9DINO|nr:unnamed protein product [Effrenium voratum]CAJ1457732.1 unnamed protein product [Effrenium voratum]
MFRSLRIAALPVLVLGDGLKLLFMADIGHSRNHADQLTNPWPMGKCAYEGAFSLYEGMEDFVVNRGEKPTAAVIIGDVAYSGGDAEVCNATRDAFQRHLHGQVPVDKVFPIMGNHDIHYLGCSKGEVLTPFSPCYYGTAHVSVASRYNMSFAQWRQNWMAAYPGLKTQVTLPKPQDRSSPKWISPMRYNLNLDKTSSVYIIAGLISGVSKTKWNNDTPAVAVDGMGEEGLECRFLKDSLAEGKRLGKTVFVYMTHDFDKACTDFSLMSQLDVWISGHKHLYWQSEKSGAIRAKELRYFPLRMTIGNGGFDEGESDVVSFGYMRETPYTAGGVQRVKVRFEVYDTCISAQSSCPKLGVGGPYCWDQCKNISGGIDGGGGPRKATVGQDGIGFEFDAPRRPKDVQPKHWASELFGQSWLLGFGEDRWLGYAECPHDAVAYNCLAPGSEENAVPVRLFADGAALPLKGSPVKASLALQDSTHAFVVHEAGNVTYQGKGFWDKDFSGRGKMRAWDADVFTFLPKKAGGWEAHGLRVGEEEDKEYIYFDEDGKWDVVFKPVGDSRAVYI